MGIVERVKIEGRGIKRWYRKNVMPYDYKVLKRNDNGTAVGPAMRVICPTNVIIHNVNGNDEIFYDINKIFYLCRNRLTEERLERNFQANAFKLTSIIRKRGNRITIIVFQPLATKD
ncbi:MAG: hypothetical protein AAB820_01470 [Patescibacteria group bacterium]